jgi:DNA-binding response OmpR family regulator
VEKISILIADEDESIRSAIRKYAAINGYQHEEVGDGISALKHFGHTRFGYSRFALALLNTDLAEIDGLLVCRQIRKVSNLPILFLSKTPSDEQCLAAFAAGGNDYIRCPVSVEELQARIGGFLRLIGQETRNGYILFRDILLINTSSRNVYVDDREILLTPKEYELLLFLSENPNKAFSRNSLLNNVWGYDFVGSDRTVDTHIKLLREHLKPYNDFIITVWGFGYRFNP